MHRLRSITVLILLLAACGRSDEGLPRIVVGVASSMTEVANDVAATYAKASVELSVAGSQVVVAQVRDGAPLDVVIVADEETANTLFNLAGAEEPVLFARNRLAIAVAEDNPLGISGLEDLSDDRLTLVLAAPGVPAGNYTVDLLQRAGVSVTPSSLEPSVRSVLAKVRLGEADAGIVYRTDLALGGVFGIDILDGLNPITEYYAVPLQDSAHPQAARDFVAFLLSSEAQALLYRRGFLP